MDNFALPNPDNINPNFEPSGIALPEAGVGQTGGVAAASAETHQHSMESDVTTATAVIAPNVGLANAIRTADMQFRQDKRKDALSTLSIFYNTPNISAEQRGEMLARLDPLAQRSHLLKTTSAGTTTSDEPQRNSAGCCSVIQCALATAREHQRHSKIH